MKRVGWRFAMALLLVTASSASDDHGETLETATLLELGGPPLPGSLAGTSDVDVFRLDVVGRASVEVYTSGQTDTRGELLDGSGSRLASDDSSGPGAGNFLVSADLEPGIYYIEVSGEGGAYAISARLGDSSDHGDTAATATLLTLYNEADLAQVSPNALLATSGRIWPSRNDVDVFRLDVLRDAAEVTIRTAGATDTFGQVLDGALNQMAADDDGDGSFRIEVRLDAGTYYLEVGGHEVGAYRVLAWESGEPCDCGTALPGVDRSIVRYLSDRIDRGESPGLIAAIVDGDGIRAIAADGVRRAGSPEPFLVSDLLVVNSNTKAMTAVMLATLVADGTFDDGWETTLGNTFPELVGQMHGAYVDVTLWDLLSMASGLKKNPPNFWDHQVGSLVEWRYSILREQLAKPPLVEKGEHHYSNLSYMVAGAMAERASGANWETLMRERLFGPLRMSTAGFGVPAAVGQVDQPWGHWRDAVTGEWAPTAYVNAPSLGPAGTVYLSMEDWAKFAGLWLQEEPAILDRDSLNRLVSPTYGRYAGGWWTWGAVWARGRVIGHTGTETWRTEAWVAPDIGRAFLVAANANDYESTGVFVTEIVEDLIGHTTGVSGIWLPRISTWSGLREEGR